MQTLTICVPEHTKEKLAEMAEYYGMPVDMLVQKLMVDQADSWFDLVVVAERKRQGKEF